jgi:hypothetical protein
MGIQQAQQPLRHKCLPNPNHYRREMPKPCLSIHQTHHEPPRSFPSRFVHNQAGGELRRDSYAACAAVSLPCAKKSFAVRVVLWFSME